MESGTDDASSEGVLKAVSKNSEVFQNILAPLQDAHLFAESKHSFTYESAVLIRNPALEEKYNGLRAKKRDMGYSEEELEESYGFMLLHDINQVKVLGEVGVVSGNNTCTVLGDPLKGVYISTYSDCLGRNHWSNGKSGYIAIVRLTKGRVKLVPENYTHHLTAPTEGFDCHMSEQWLSVSDQSSLFLAFGRTQCYIYELLDSSRKEVATCPSLVCPFAVVCFSYSDSKAASETPKQKSEIKPVNHYFPWRGQVQIGTQLYDVELKSSDGAIIPAKLPPLVKVHRAIPMFELMQLLPKAFFESCFSGEVPLAGLYCTMCQLMSSVRGETSSLSVLLQEMKDKDIALIVPLNDAGFLILLHSSHFIPSSDTDSNAAAVLQGTFVFPDSRVIERGHYNTNSGREPPQPDAPSEILRVLPVLSCAESEAEKGQTDQSGERCDVLVRHMQTYAALIDPAQTSSPSREPRSIPDQFDVPGAHTHLYLCPEWTKRACQSIRAYISKPASFQLPLSKASEILTAGQEQHNDLYICPSAPQDLPPDPFSMESEDPLVDHQASVEGCAAVSEAPADSTAFAKSSTPSHLQTGGTNTETSGLITLIKTEDAIVGKLQTPTTSDYFPTELIVSITSEQSFTDKSSLRVRDDLQLPAASTDKSQRSEGSSLTDRTVGSRTVTQCPKVSNPTKAHQRNVHWGRPKGRKKVSKGLVETVSSPAVKMPEEDDKFQSLKDDRTPRWSGQWHANKPSSVDPRKQRKLQLKLPGGKKLRVSLVDVAAAEKKTSHPGQQVLDMDSLRQKMERWVLKPIVTACGRLLVPYGCADRTYLTKAVKDQVQCVDGEQSPVGMEQDHTCPETPVDEVEEIKSKDEGNSHGGVVGQGPGDGRGPLSSTGACPSKNSQDIQEKHTDPISGGVSSGGFPFSKLKTIILQRKRKRDLLTAAGSTQTTQSAFEISDTDSGSEMLENDEMGNAQDVSKVLSVDPEFIRALGLTAKDPTSTTQTPEDEDTQLRKSPQAETSAVSDRRPQIIQRPPSIFPKSSRMKTLRNHRGLAALYVKNERWLHFQPPSDICSERLNHDEMAENDCPIEAEKEQMDTARSSTDALNLLADLALGASSNQVSPHLTGDGASREQESVLHALLRQPPHTQLHGGGGWAGLVSKEHAYSLPWSSSVPPGSPATGYAKKRVASRKRFRHSRQFVERDGTVQVTRQWKEKYDFSLDSRIPTTSNNRAIIRGLHGPWDSSSRDTGKEVRLIFHMWIGLFYSRSTGRTFDFSFCSNERDSVAMSGESVPGITQSELKSPSLASSPSPTDTLDQGSVGDTVDQGSVGDTVDQGSVGDTVDQGSVGDTVDQGSVGDTLDQGSVGDTLDQGSVGDTVDQGSVGDTVDQGSVGDTLDQGSDGLDVPLRNSLTITSDPLVSREEASASSVQLDQIPTTTTQQRHREVVPPETVSEGNDGTSRRTLQKHGCLKNTDTTSSKGGTVHVLHGSIHGATGRNAGCQHSEAGGRGGGPKPRIRSLGGRPSAHSVENSDLESKEWGNWEDEETPHQEGDMMIQTEDEPTEREAGTSEEHLSAGRDLSAQTSSVAQGQTKSLQAPAEGRLPQRDGTDHQQGRHDPRQLVVSVDRSPTPAVDDKPPECASSSSPCSSSTSPFSAVDMCNNISSRSSTRVMDETEQKLCDPSTVSTDPYTFSGASSGLGVRTQRVLKYLDELLSTSRPTDVSPRPETLHMKVPLDPACSAPPGHTPTDYEGQINNHLGRKRTDSSVQHHYSERGSRQCCHSKISFLSLSCHCLQDTPTSPSRPSEKVHAERPVMAVKPSKSSEDPATSPTEGDNVPETSTSRSDEAQSTFQDRGRNGPPSTRPEADWVSQVLDGNTNLLAAEKVERSRKENVEVHRAGCSVASSVPEDDEDVSMADGSQSSLLFTVVNKSQQGSSSLPDLVSPRCQHDVLTEVSIEQECLVFTEKMKQLLKRRLNKDDTQGTVNLPCIGPVTGHCSPLGEQQDLVDHLDASVLGQKVKVDVQAGVRETNCQESSRGTSHQLDPTGVSDVAAECASQHQGGVDKKYPKNGPADRLRFCGQSEGELEGGVWRGPESTLNPSVKSQKRFFMFETSEDVFFQETKAQLEARGFTAVQPSQFLLGKTSSSLLILLRNEDIAEHICEIPHLLELKKSPGVKFAGIDEPCDVINLTHQELFLRGGFVMVDQATLETLSLSDMKKISDILQDLRKTSKWKWMLHYRDSRRLKENARLGTEAKEKKQFLNCCQEAGLMEVLPYHECDPVSKDRPDYLTCLVRLQIQNISARFPVFITGTTNKDEFGRNGIVTMTVEDFLTTSASGLGQV